MMRITFEKLCAALPASKFDCLHVGVTVDVDGKPDYYMYLTERSGEVISFDMTTNISGVMETVHSTMLVGKRPRIEEDSDGDLL